MPAYQCLSSLVGSECEGRRRGMARIVGRQRVKLVREAEEDREKKESSFFFSETSPGLLCTSSKTQLATFCFFLNYLAWDWKRNVEYTVHILSLINALDGEFQTVERRKARECVCCGGPTSSLSLHLVPLVNQNRGDNRTNTWANS